MGADSYNSRLTLAGQGYYEHLVMVVMSSKFDNILLGPFYDLKRFLVGAVSDPPPTRIEGESDLAAVRAVLTGAQCNLQCCTEENLHTGLTSLPPEHVYNLLRTWQLWPCSSFFACLRTDQQDVEWFAYRWYKLLPIVKMRLKSAAKPHHIIYDIVWGIGNKGYHSFLIDQLDEEKTAVSIYTTFPPTHLFFEGLHDQMNRDIFRKLSTIEGAKVATRR